jgi:sec-independent protein translocase protein TatC
VSDDPLPPLDATTGAPPEPRRLPAGDPRVSRAPEIAPPAAGGGPHDPPPPRPPAVPGRRPRPADDEGDPRVTGEMPFLAHLEELRKVLLHSLAACVVGAVAGWWLSVRVLEDLIHRTVRTAVVLSPLEAFNERIKLALFIGLIITLPFVFLRIWQFVVPGLFRRERRLILPMALISMVLFALGVWAAYGYVLPLVIDVLEQFLTPSMKAEIRVSTLLGLFYNLALACGLVCQLPLVTMAITALGLVTPMTLLRGWRYALVIVFLTTALITPGDVVTAQLIMGVPMTALYFFSVGLSWLVARRRSRAENEEVGHA